MSEPSAVEQTLPKCELCNDSIFPKNPEQNKRYSVRFKRYDILCQDCYNSERVKLEDGKPIMEQSLEVIVSSREQFFNAERTDIALIEGTHFERIIAIRERIDKWKNLLFEINTRRESAYSLMQELAQNITIEERNKLKISDLTYVPGSSGTPKTVKPRVSSEDKALNSLANTLFGFKVKKGEMTLEESLEKAKLIIRQGRNSTFGKIASGELKCSCNVTPGICKVHEKV